MEPGSWLSGGRGSKSAGAWVSRWVGIIRELEPGPSVGGTRKREGVFVCSNPHLRILFPLISRES